MGTVILGVVILVTCYFATRHVEKAKGGCFGCPGAYHCNYRH